MLRFLRTLLIPGGVVFWAALIVLIEAGEEPLFATWCARLAPALPALAVALAWRLHRRAPLVVAAALLGILGLRFLPDPVDGAAVAAALQLTLPLFLVACGLGDRQLSPLGAAGLGAALVVACAGLVWRGGALEAVGAWAPLALPFALPAPQLVSGLWLGAGLVLLLRAARGRAWAFQVLAALALAAVAGRPDFGVALAGLLLVVELIEHAHQLAFRDELTGLPGRRALREALARLPRRAAVAMCDIDHFKKLNDRYGHAEGDKALVWVARKLEATSGGARVYRFGGEEFTVLFPGLSSAQAVPHLEATCALLREERLPLRPEKGGPEQPVAVTLSVGVADTRTEGTEGRLLEVADEALYRAKRQGRDQVCAAGVKARAGGRKKAKAKKRKPAQKS